MAKPLPTRRPIDAPFIEPSAPVTSPVAYKKAPMQLMPTPPPEQIKSEPLAGPNVMKVVLVGAECAPWSKTGKKPRSFSGGIRVKNRLLDELMPYLKYLCFMPHICPRGFLNNMIVSIHQVVSEM